MEAKYPQSGRAAKTNTHRRSSVTSARAFKDIPRVQIFLDSQLKKAITKIQQESTFKKNQNTKHQTKGSIQQPQEQSFKPLSERKSSASQNKKLETVTFMSNDVVLDYIKDVYQKYGIKNPFEGYLDESSGQRVQKQEVPLQKFPSFSDRKQAPNEPAQVESSIRTHKKQRKISQNQARIFQLKNKFKQTIQNEPFVSDTMKKTIRNLADNGQFTNEQNSHYEMDFIKKSQGNITYIDNLANLMESQVNDTYDFENDTTFNRTAHEQTPERSTKRIEQFQEETYHDKVAQSPQVQKPKKKLFVKTRTTSTKYNEKQGTPDKYDKYSQMKVTFNMFELDPKRERQLESSKRSAAINKIQENPSVITSQVYENKASIANSLVYSHENGQIPQVYRYCLGCETAILDSNVLFHEKKCVYLRQIQGLSAKELYQFVQAKMDRLKKEISKSDLMNLKLKDMEEIRERASTILTQKSKKDEIQDQNLAESNFREQFIKVNSLLSKKLLNGCEMIKKLEWFTKVRENLQKNYIFRQNSFFFDQQGIGKSQTN